MYKIDPLNSELSNHCYLGFDFGSKKIGVAVGDAELGIANPLKTLQSHQQSADWQAITKLITEWKPIGLVVGISKQNDGTDNIITPKMQKFCRQLNGRYQLPVFQVDESLSTFAAKQMIFEDLQVSAGKLWSVQDQVAAQLILQSWFNQTSNSSCL